jgi:hypothetical protein
MKELEEINEYAKMEYSEPYDDALKKSIKFSIQKYIRYI